jgi:photosystem II stability/assembly factor-like uncharacterized protein
MSGRNWVNARAAGLVGLALLSSASHISAAWVNATGNLANMPSECGDLQSIYAVPNVNLTVTGVANNGIYATSDGGTTWTRLTNLATMRMMQMHFDPDHPDTWYAGGIYHTPGIVKTTDAGATWVGFNGIGTNDGFSVDFSDPQRLTLLAGGHESQGNLYRSTDAGATWTNIGCPTGGYSSFPYIVDTQTYLMGIQGVGMYRSTDAGGSWTQVSSVAPISHILKTEAGDLYYTGGSNVNKGSSDGATWTRLNNILVAGAAPVELPGGKIAIINGNGIAVSDNKGATWSANRCRPLPSVITSFWAFNVGIGFAYNSVAGAFYTFHWGCASAVAPDEIWRFDTLITGDTEVATPRRGVSALTDLSVVLQEGALVFDVGGRAIGRSAVEHFGSSRPGAVYIVRSAEGAVTKRVLR